ncbi:MAG TPA: TIGR02281 family clan AA aspartic protease [Bauldia sp.]|nr:TIGR02281 family clan AA aspartic protease [Bauldia sp.]
MEPRFIAIAIAALIAAVAVPQVIPGIVNVMVGSDSAALLGGAEPEAPHEMTLTANNTGHYTADAIIDGHTVPVVVDTGATTVAITSATARELGINPGERDFNAEVRTANGLVHAARVTLGVVSIGNVTVRDVPAIVVEGDALELNLLGMSFLNRLTKFEAGDGQLVLVQ